MSQTNQFEFSEFLGERSIKRYIGNDEVVHIPEDVTVLERGAFAGNHTVREIYIPDSVTTIGNEAFYNCTNLKKLVFPKTLFRCLGQNVADKCTSLEEITLPGGNDICGFGTLFEGCTSLKRIYIPANCNHIHPTALSSLDVEIVVDPAHRQYVFENGCLLDKQSGTVIYMREKHTFPPEAVTAMLCLRNIRCETFTLPPSITTIHAVGALPQDAELRELRTDAALMSLEGTALFGSTTYIPEKAVTYLTAPNTSLSVFTNTETKQAAAKGFAKHIVSGGVANEGTEAEYLAFIRRNRSKLIDDPFIADYLVMQGIIKASAIDSESVTLRSEWDWTEDSLGNIIITDYKGSKSVVTVPAAIGRKRVTVIGDFAFAAYDPNDFSVNQTSIKEHIRPFRTTPTALKRMMLYAKQRQAILQINLPAGLEVIGNNAFRNCTALKRVTIPGSVHTVGHYAFTGCRSLKRMVFPESCSLGEGVLSRCASLRSASLPSDITSIPACMFHSCEALEEFVIPESTETVKAEAFAFCNSLKRITIGSNVSEIKQCVFAGSARIEQFEVNRNEWFFVRERCLFDGQDELIAAGLCAAIPEGTVSIGAGALAGSLLESILLPASVRSVAANAFSYCDNLRHLIFNQEIPQIPEAACCYCPRLETLVVPGNVRTIGRLAFQYCGIRELTLEEGVECIHDFAFKNNPMDRVVLPLSLLELDKNSFPITVRTYYARAATPPKGWRREGGRKAMTDPNSGFVWSYTGK